MNAQPAPTHFNVFTVEEFDAPTKEDRNHKGRSWTKVGVAFPHKEGPGFNLQLKALPVDGTLVVLPAEAPETDHPNSNLDFEPAPERSARFNKSTRR